MSHHNHCQFTSASPLFLLSYLELHLQSLFLARVTSYDKYDRPNDWLFISTVGYSLIAITITLLFGATLCLLELANGFRRFEPGMPLSSCCSAVISAACHPAPYHTDGATKPVMWGIIGGGSFATSKCEVGKLGLCSFTSFEAEKTCQRSGLRLTLTFLERFCLDQWRRSTTTTLESSVLLTRQRMSITTDPFRLIKLVGHHLQ